MYNRYIPQSDGTFRRSTVQERPAPIPNPERVERKEQPAPCPPEPAEPCPAQNPRKAEPRQRPRGQKPPAPCRQPQSAPPTSAGAFLRNLLPGDLDTGDLLVIVLLLLMAGDGADNQNTALLTLAIYLFL